MDIRKFNLLFLFLSLILVCCSDNKVTRIYSQNSNQNQGIPLSTLELIYDGPENFTLDYFPKAAVQAAGVKTCYIIQRDSTSSRVARRAQFDRNGSVTRDENSFFFYWFKGTGRGTYIYQYNGAGKRIKMVGIHQEDSKDSVMTIWNYNTQGLLNSREAYQFAKRLKPGADWHLPNPRDYEKYPTWGKEETYRFSITHDSVTIETLVEEKLVKNEKYHLLYDSTKRLEAVKMFQNGYLAETIDYTYEPNGITGYIKRTMNDGKKWTYKSKAVLDEKGKQIEKIGFDENGSEKVKMLVDYNVDGTIKNITCGNTVQEFRYTFY